MCQQDKVLLRKQAVIESANNQLKNISQIEHSYHRSAFNFLVNPLAGLAAYTNPISFPTTFLRRT